MWRSQNTNNSIFSIINGQVIYRTVLCIILSASNNAFALTLEQAEQLAVQADPAVERYLATSRSFEETSIADDTLPDPRLRLGAVNVPTDSFDLEQEQMTQLRLGVQQNFPRGDSLSKKRQKSRLLSDAASTMADAEKLRIIREVRENYLNLYYEVTAYEVVRETRKLFNELLKITESSYAAGRVNQQDVMLADLEMSRLDDRAAKILIQQETYQAKLSQWIGDIAWGDIDMAFPVLPTLPGENEIEQLIVHHPLIRAQDARIAASKKNTEIAEQDYKPGWSLLLDYGYRSGNNPDGSERADFATAIVSLDIPLFTADRQDRSVAASQQKTDAERYVKDDELRRLKQDYEKNLRSWKRLGEREELYRHSLLKSAKNNSRAALNAYQSGVSEFNTLMRAQITELDVRLEDLRVRVDRALAKANLLYIAGDSSNEKK